MGDAYWARVLYACATGVWGVCLLRYTHTHAIAQTQNTYVKTTYNANATQTGLDLA